MEMDLMTDTVLGGKGHGILFVLDPSLRRVAANGSSSINDRDFLGSLELKCHVTWAPIPTPLDEPHLNTESTERADRSSQFFLNTAAFSEYESVPGNDLRVTSSSTMMLSSTFYLPRNEHIPDGDF